MPTQGSGKGSSSTQNKESQTTRDSRNKIRNKVLYQITKFSRPKNKHGRSKKKGKPGGQEPGPWSPYAAFRHKQKTVENFFEGYKITTDTNLESREARARWAIELILKECLLNPKVTSGVRTSSTGQDNVTTSHGKKDARNGDNQPKLEDQIVKPTEKVGSIEIDEGLPDAVQDLLSASTNCLGPPIDACIRYLAMTPVGKYRQTNLTLWDSDIFRAAPDSLDMVTKNGATIYDNDASDDDGEDDKTEAEESEEDKSEEGESDEDDSDEHDHSDNENSVSKVRQSQPGEDTTQDANVTRGLLEHQVTAIVWIISRLYGVLPKLKPTETAVEESNRMKLRGPKYSGGILADSMGLGKTRTVVALLELMLAHELHVATGNEPGEKLHLPMLILCPNTTVAKQWIVELLERIPKMHLHKIVFGGQLSAGFCKSKRIAWLESHDFKKWPKSLEYIWNSSCPQASKTILVLPIETWALRTCSKPPSGQLSEWCSSDGSPSRRFSMVCVDEAHKVKNNGTLVWKSVSSLNRQYTLLVTATPCVNTLADLMGLARLLWGNAEVYLRSKRPKIWKQVKKMLRMEDVKKLDTVEPWSDLQLAAGWPNLLRGIIGNGSTWRSQYIDIQQTREHLAYFEKLAILRRGPSSTLFRDWEKAQRVSLKCVFPAVHYQTVCLQPDTQFEETYQSLHADLLTTYFNARLNILKKDAAKSNKGNGIPKTQKKKQPTNKPTKLEDDHLCAIYRQLQIASSSLDVHRLEQILKTHNSGTQSADIAEMRYMQADFLNIAKCFFVADGEEIPNTMVEFLKRAARGSPVLQFILHDLHENILDRKPNEKIKKLLITENRPILAYYYELVLQFIGINARTFHASLTELERQKLIKSFNSNKKSSVQIFIQMYTVGFAGTNLHQNCSRVIIANQAHSFAVQAQATHRIIRVGQTQEVKVLLCKVNNTYSDYVESNQIRKLLPELASRVRDEQKNVLARLFSKYKREGKDAWESEEGRELREDPSLVFRSTTTVHPTKAEPTITARSVQNKALPNLLDSFLSLKPRRLYIQEFMELSREERGDFNHQKNQLRRLLSFHGINNSPEDLTKEDLDDPVILERSLELALRYYLGTDNAKILPYPAIDFNMVPIDKLVKLQRSISRVDFTEIDMDIDQDAISGDFHETDELEMHGHTESNEKLSDDEQQETTFSNTPRTEETKVRNSMPPTVEDTMDQDGGVKRQDAPVKDVPFDDDEMSYEDTRGLQSSTQKAHPGKIITETKKEPSLEQTTNREVSSNDNDGGLDSNFATKGLQPSNQETNYGQIRIKIKREPSPEKTTSRAVSSDGNDDGLDSNFATSGLQPPTRESHSGQVEIKSNRDSSPEQADRRVVFSDENDIGLDSNFANSSRGFSAASQPTNSTRYGSSPRTSVPESHASNHDCSFGDSDAVKLALSLFVAQGQRGAKREAETTDDSSLGYEPGNIDDRQTKRLKQDPVIEEQLKKLQDEELD